MSLRRGPIDRLTLLCRMSRIGLKPAAKAEAEATGTCKSIFRALVWQRRSAEERVPLGLDKDTSSRISIEI